MELKHVPQSAQMFLAAGNIKMALWRILPFARNIQTCLGLADSIKQKAAALETDIESASSSKKTGKRKAKSLFVRLDKLLHEIYNS